MKKYIVGGAVRDMLLGRKPKDIDFVWVGATPQDMLNMGFNQVGADFPVFLDKEGNEHALARTERKVGRGYNGFETDFNPSVTLEQDLYRRDLTINAIAMDPETEELIDPFGGAEDLQDGALRHVSPAFREDPLRVLRVARFRARFGKRFRIVTPTLELMEEIANSGELNHLTPERIWSETSRAIMETFPELFFSTLHVVNALENMFNDEQALMLRRGTHALVSASDFGMTMWQRFVAFLVEAESSSGKVSQSFLKDIKAPKDIAHYVEMGHFLMNTLFALTNEEEVDMSLTMIKKFRLNQSQHMEQLSEIGQVLALTQRNNPTHMISRKLRALRAAAIATVNTEGLEGKEIGQAIENRRREILTQMIY